MATAYSLCRRSRASSLPKLDSLPLIEAKEEEEEEEEELDDSGSGSSADDLASDTQVGGHVVTRSRSVVGSSVVRSSLGPNCVCD